MSKFTEYEKEKILDIKQRLRALFDNSFTKSEEEFVIAGGVFVSLFHNEIINDIDVFVLDDENAKKIAQEHLDRVVASVAHIKGAITFGDNDYRNNENITRTCKFKASKIQMIWTKFKTRDELLNHFDFLHARMCYYKGQLYVTREIYDSIRDKQLVINNRKYLTDARIKKYTSRGWTLPEKKSLTDIVNEHEDNIQFTTGYGHTKLDDIDIASLIG